MFSFASPRLLPRYANIPYMPLAEHPNPRRRFVKHLWKLLVAMIVVAAAITTICLLHNPKLGRLQQPGAPIPVIPKDFRVVGLVFYGRRSRVEILDCYLRQNLKANGGLLDQIIFLGRTDDVEDLAFLDQLVGSTEGYVKHDLTDKNSRASKVTYGQAWEVVERGVMYVKIDDDIMFIEKNAIASLIAAKIAHPEHLLISTNTVNSPRLAFLHAHLGAIHPFLPELSPPSSPPPLSSSLSNPNPLNQPTSWRPSLLPPWDGNPLTSSFPARPRPANYALNHRWLPLPAPYNTSLTGTPISAVEYEHSTEGLTNWAVAAQEHMSFLRNAESGELGRYGGSAAFVGAPEGGRGEEDERGERQGRERKGWQGIEREERLWDMQGTRVQVNMIAIWGDDVADHLPVPSDDEAFLTVELPRRVGRRAVVDLNAVAVHFAFRHQREGMERTDVLGRYMALAQERGVCR